MLKCTGYRFKSFHGVINGNQCDSEKLIFSYVSDEDPGVVGYESHTIDVRATNQRMLGERVGRLFGVTTMTDQMGNLIAPELDSFIKQPILISCSFDENRRAIVNRVIIDHPLVTGNDTTKKQ